MFGLPEKKFPIRLARPCLLWFLILVAMLLVLALFFGGFRKGTQTSGLARCLAAPQMTAAHVTGVRR